MRFTFVLAVVLFSLVGTVQAQVPKPDTKQQQAQVPKPDMKQQQAPKPDMKEQLRQLVAKRRAQRRARVMCARMREQAKIDMMNRIAAENQKRYMELLPYMLEQERLSIMRMSAKEQADALNRIARSIDNAAFQKRLKPGQP